MEQNSIIQCVDFSLAEVVTAGAAKWELGKAVQFMWMPGGKHTIRAHYEKKPIELTVDVQPDTAGRVQASYEGWFTKVPSTTPFGCIEHREQEASVRLPKESSKFEWANDSIQVTAQPTSLGVNNVNGGVHASWSPSFTTDAEYGRAKTINGTLVFPRGAKGSKENPAKVTGVAFAVGTLTNKPAFRQIASVMASEADIEAATVADKEAVKSTEETEEGVVEATWSDAARDAAVAARKKHSESASYHYQARDAYDRSICLMAEGGGHTEHFHAAQAHAGAGFLANDLGMKGHATGHDGMRKMHLKEEKAIRGKVKASESTDPLAHLSPDNEILSAVAARYSEPADPLQSVYDRLATAEETKTQTAESN